MKLSKGANLSSSKFSKLKHLIQTGFYSYPGTYKFKHILTYASKNFNSLSLPSFDSGRPFYTYGGKTFSFGDL